MSKHRKKIIADTSWKIRQKVLRCWNFMNLPTSVKGIGTVEVILILVVLIALVLIFKTQLTDLVNTIFEKITSESSGI